MVYSFRLLHYFLISCGILKKYRDLPLHKLRHLAVVLDSEEAADTSIVRNLLQFLSNIGVRNVILYDMDGESQKLCIRSYFSREICCFGNFDFFQIYHIQVS